MCFCICLINIYGSDCLKFSIKKKILPVSSKIWPEKLFINFFWPYMHSLHKLDGDRKNLYFMAHLHILSGVNSMHVYIFLRSPESLRWPSVMGRYPWSVNISSRNSGPILTNLVWSIGRVRRQEIVNLMTPHPKGR